MSRKCKTISFDLTDGFERDLLDHAEANGKFSKYIKRLIQEDKNGSTRMPMMEKFEVEDADDDAMESFL